MRRERVLHTFVHRHHALRLNVRESLKARRVRSLKRPELRSQLPAAPKIRLFGLHVNLMSTA